MKTRDAELRGVCNLAKSVKQGIVPLFELTKSRSNPRAKDGLIDGPVQKRVEKIQHDYGTGAIGLDLTSIPALQNQYILTLLKNDNGFNEWVNYVNTLKNVFPDLIPVLMVSDAGIATEDRYIDLHKQEAAALGHCAYRTPLDYGGMVFDIQNFFTPDNFPTVVLDAGYIPQNQGTILASKILPIIKSIHNTGVTEIILAGSSYPSDPTTNNAGRDSGENILEEVRMYLECKRAYPNLIYGDYATLYPSPSDREGGRGWIPRIDFPTCPVNENDCGAIVYHRSRRDKTETSYAHAYRRAARKVIQDPRFGTLKQKIGDKHWGIQQILSTADGDYVGLSPSFWISVRINLHITLRQLILSDT